MWQLNSPESPRSFAGHFNPVYEVQFAPDGKMIASSSGDNTIKLWELSTGRIVHSFNGHTDIVKDIAFSGNGHIIASTSSDKTIKIWNVATGEMINSLSGNFVTALEIAPNNRFLVTGDQDGQIHIWQVEPMP